LLAGFPADYIGRKYTLIGASFLFIIGSIFQAASNGVALLCVGRVLNGIVFYNKHTTK
jgi:MFS family permease